MSYHDNRHFQMKKVDIEGFKITVKNMTMLTRSTTIKSELQVY